MRPNRCGSRCTCPGGRPLRSGIGYPFAFSSEGDLIHLPDQDVGVAIDADRTPVVDVVAELAVAADAEVRLQVDPGEAVVHPGALAATHLRLGHAVGALDRVVDDADPGRDARADRGAGAVDTVVVVDLDPIVVLDLQPGGVLLAQPAWLHAAGQRKHAQRVAVGRVDVPLAMRRQHVEHPGLAVVDGLAQVAVDRRLGRRLVGRQMLAKGDVAVVIEIEVLAAGERAPRHVVLDVVRERRIGTASGHQPGPDRRVVVAPRLGLEVAVVNQHTLVILAEVAQRQPGFLLGILVGAVGQLAVGQRREVKHRLDRFDVLLERRIAAAVDDLDMILALEQAVVEVRAVVAVAVSAKALGAHIGTQRRVLGIDLGVVAFLQSEFVHRLAKYRLALTGPPVLHPRLRDLVNRVVRQRQRHDVGHLARQVLLRHFADTARDAPEDVPVGLRLPNRGDGCTQRVDEGVHVRRVEIVLFVPGRRWQHNVRIQGRRVHAEIQIDHQVHLSARGDVAPHDLLDVALGRLVGNMVVMRAKVMIEKVLMTLGTGADGVAAPDEPDARPILLGIGIGHGVTHFALAKLVEHVALDLVIGLRPGFARRLDELDRVDVELREVGHPAVAHRLDDEVSAVLVGDRVVGCRVVGALLAVVAPLVGVHVVPDGRLLHSRAAVPVARGHDGSPGVDRRQLLLPDVVVHPAAVDADASRQHQRHHGSSIHQVAVEPVVDPGTDDDHALAVGLLGGAAPLAGELQHGVGADAGEHLLPGRGVRGALVVVALRVGAGKAAVNPVLRHDQVVHRRHRHPPVDRVDPADRHPALGAQVQPVFVELDRGDIIVPVQEGQLRVVRGAIDGVLHTQVPVARRLVPTVANAALGHHELAGLPVDVEELPVAVLDVAVLGDLVGTQQTSGLEPFAARGELDQVGAVRRLLDVVDEVRRVPLVVPLRQHHVGDRHPECAVTAGVHWDPLIGILRDHAEVGRQHHRLRAVVP